MTFPKFSLWLKEVAAGLALFLLAMLLIAFAGDQVRHLWSQEYRDEQRLRHGFLCFDQSIGKTEGATGLEEVEYNVGALLDVARQEVTPTDAYGKLSLFALCANFTKVGAGGLEISGPKADTTRLRQLKAKYVVQRMKYIEQLRNEIEGFPVDVHDDALALLRPHVQKVAETEAQQGEVGENPQAVDAGRDNIAQAWLLVTGGDQDDESAAFQVAATQRLIDGLPADLKQTAGSAQLYLSRSWRRTVVPFGTKADADKALQVLGDRLRYGGYVRSNFAWCPDLSPAENIKDIATTRCEN